MQLNRRCVCCRVYGWTCTIRIVWLVFILNQGLSVVPPPINLTMAVSGVQTFLVTWNVPPGYSPGKFSRGQQSNSSLDEYSLWMGNFGILSTLTPIATQSSLLPTSFALSSQAFDIKIGGTFYIRLISRSCCSALVSTFFSRACTNLSCTSSSTAFSSDTNAYPLNGYAEASATALGYPTAPTSINISIFSDNVTYPSKGKLNVQWTLPSNTGSGAQVASDILAYLIVRAQSPTFSDGVAVFYGLPTPSAGVYSFLDTQLTVDVLYFYRINARNLACGSGNATCGTNITGSQITTGVPSAPQGFASVLVDAQHAALSWVPPADTGRGAGAPSSSEPLLRYEVWAALCNISGECAAGSSAADLTLLSSTANASVNSTLLSGLAGARRYFFFLRAVNRAGGGAFANATQLTLQLPTAPQNFTAVVRADYGPLRILLSWAVPDNTGQGPGSQVEPILGYRLYVDDPPGAFNTSSARLLAEGMNRTFVAEFSAARRAPYIFMVVAANVLGYAVNGTGGARASEQAVAAPSPPRNLTAAVVGVRRIRLQWAPPADTGVGDGSRPLVSYGIEASRDANFSRAGNASGAALQVVDPSAASLNASVADVGPGFYFFRVYAVNGAGQSGASNVASEQGVSLPGPPSNLTAALSGEGAVALTWQLPLDTGIAGPGRAILRFRATVSANGSTIQTQSLAGTALNVTFAGLGHLTVYLFAMYASNDAGESGSPATIYFQPAALPSAPSLFTASVTMPLSILLTWALPSDTGRGGQSEVINSYLLEQDSVGASFQNITVIAFYNDFCDSLGMCSLLVNFTAARKAPYWFRIRARNVLGLGNFSVSSEQSINVPSAIPKISVLVNKSRQIILTWVSPVDTGVGDASRPLKSYVVLESFGDPNVSAPSIYTFANTTLSVFRNYNFTSSLFLYFRILAVNDAGRSSFVYTVKEQSIDTPTAPVMFNVALLGPLYMGLTWSLPINTGIGDQSRALKDFVLFMGRAVGSINLTVGNIVFTKENVISPNVTSWNKTGFQKGFTYFFHIQAENDAGFGDMSPTVQMPAIDLPLSPANFSASVRLPLQINLTWSTPTDTGFFQKDESRLTGYFLEQSEYSDFHNFSSINIRSILAFNYFISTGLRKGKPYYFRLSAANAAGLSQPAYASEESIDVPSSPLVEAVINGPLEIKISWQKPEDTGLGTGIFPSRPLRGYVMELVVSEFITPPPQQISISSVNISYSFLPNVSSFLLQNLIQGRIYLVRVRADNDAGHGNYSNVASRPAIDKPSAPTNLRVFTDDFLHFSVSWNVPADTGLGASVIPPWPLLKFYLQVALDSSFLNNAINFSFDANVTNCSLGNLSKGALYYLRVFAINTVGNSPPSNMSKEHAVGKPSPPQHFTVQVSTTSQLQLFLSWSIPQDTGLGGLPCFVSCSGVVREIDKYLIQRVSLKDPPDFVAAASPQIAVPSSVNFTGAIQFYSVGSLSVELNDSNLQKGMTYYYRVFALNSAGISDPSEVSFEMAMSRPSMVQNASIEITGESKLTLSWSGPADSGNGNLSIYRRPLLYYLIEVDNVSSNFGHVIFQQNVPPQYSEASFTNPWIYAGSRYSFRIAAVNAAGQGQFLDQGRSYSPGRYQVFNSDLSQTAIVKPSSPLNYSVFISNPGELTIKWKPPLLTGSVGQIWPLLEYIVEMDTVETFNSFVKIFDGRTLYGIDINSISLANAVYAVTQGSLDGGVVYYFRVIAVNEAGYSIPSMTMKHIALYNPPVAQNFTAAVVGPVSINVSFSLPPLPLGEVILRYILEMEIIPDNFVDSPFISSCFPSKIPPCALSGNSPYDLGIMGSSGIIYSPMCPSGLSTTARCTSWRHNVYSGTYSVLMTGLTRGQVYYFRVFLQNEVGLSDASATISEQAVSLPSAPRSLALQLKSSLSFILSWSAPSDTGNGSSTWPLTVYGIQLQARENLFQISFSDLDIVKYVPGTLLTSYLTDQVENVHILYGVRYFVRIFAVNQAGRGDYSSIESNGPVLKSIIPNSGPSIGGFKITVHGLRLGDSAQPGDIQMKIGETVCSKISFIMFQTSFSCTAPPGISGRYPVTISVDNLTVVQENGFGYDKPKIRQLQPSLISIKGGDLVTVSGTNFGTVDSNPNILIVPEHEGPQKCSSTLWFSDSSLVCVTAAQKIHARINNSVVVKINTQTSPVWSDGTYLSYYDIPEYFQCERSTSTDCFHCVFEKCSLQEINSAVVRNAGNAFATSNCELKSMEYCNYTAVEYAITKQIRRDSPDSNLGLNPTQLGSVCGGSSIQYEVDTSFRVLRSNCCPSKVYYSSSILSTGLLSPQSQDMVFWLPLIPKLTNSSKPLSTLRFSGIIGVAIDGIPFYSNYGTSGENLLRRENSTLDSCGGHVSPSGVYHYHLNPICLYSNTPGLHSPLLGFMLDGIPVYGEQDEGGLSPANLDDCNGHIDKQLKIYHYHMTEAFPHHIKCFRGCLLDKSAEAVNWSLMGKSNCNVARRQPLNFLKTCFEDEVLKIIKCDMEHPKS